MPARINMPHPLKNTGTRQIDRLIKALSPEYFQLDDRSKQDLINSAYEYAKMLRWHGPDGRPDDNWACFWEVETLTYMAILAALDTRQIRKEYDDLDAEFGLALERLPEKSKSLKDGDVSEIAPQYYRQLMDAVRNTAWRLETHYRNLHSQVPLKAQILQLIRKNNDFEYEPDQVEGALQQLIAFHKGADDGLLPEKYQDFYDKTQVTDHRWGVKDRDDYDCILPEGGYTREKVRALFLVYYNALVAVKNRARQLFDAEIQLIEQPEEVAPRRLEPHIALFIAFLNLFRHAQDSLNEIPRRHLDFYYDCVLGLTRKPAEPDQTYLIFTLAKEFSEEMIEKGTLLLGGKDDKGQPVYFETIEDWKVTKAQVADLKAAYFHHPKQKVTQITVLPDSKVKFKNQLADDKLPVISWRAFGDDADLPLAKTGIAISSPQLILREGLRVVEITIMFLDSVELTVSPLKSDDFVLELSTKKKWETLAFDETLYDEDGESKDDKKTDKIGAFDLFAIEDEDHSRKTKGLKLLLVLEKDFEPVEQLEEANVLSDGTGLKWPALKIFFPPSWCEHHIQFGEITITVEVSDIRENLIIQTDQGVFDGTQTILPFGPVPEIGNQFYIGSTEVFQKALVELDLEFGWIGAPDLYSNHYYLYPNVLPVPKLKVDFIDAASVVPAKFADIGGGASQLVPKSYQLIAAGNNAISFNLTDMRGARITEEVELVVGTVTATKNPENGLYEIEVPGSSEFIANIISSDENYVFKNVGLKYPDYLNYISPEYDVILKPERVTLKSIAIAERVDCFFTVKRLDNVDVTDIEITVAGDVQRGGKFIGDRYQIAVDNISGAIGIASPGCDRLEFDNEKGFTDFEVVLRPTGLEPNRNVEVSDKSNPTASPKLLVEDILTQQPVSGVAVSILGQNYLTNESGEIDLSGIDFEVETSISANHLFFNQFSGQIPENSTDKNLTIKIEPQPVLYRAVCAVTDNFFVTVPNVSIEINDGTNVLLEIGKISPDEPEFNLLFSRELLNQNPILRFIQADNAYLEFSSPFNNLLENKPNPTTKKYLISEFTVRLDEANSNEFDLIVTNKIKRVFPIEIRASNLERDIRTQYFEKYSPTLKRGFIRFTLFKNDFLHKQYPKLLAIPGYAQLIEAPYTPSVNFISLSYKSVQTIVAPQDGVDGFYHLLPFDGYKKISLIKPKGDASTPLRLPLLPTLLPEPSTTHFHHNIGNLYIGLETLVPGDNLSLLIQLEEGSEVNQEALPPVVNWYYLSDNEWKAFGVEKILSDTTRGLMRSGVLQLAIPIDATKNNTLLNPDFHWISAKTVENEDGSESVGAFAAIKSIRAQAVKARYQIREGADLSRLARTLPPQSISKLAFARSEVKKIEQPYASFDGKLPEAHSSEYYRRISERLRHKDRAITAWDYENLLMEQYPYIAVARCISHTRYETAGEFEGQSEWSPGFVSLAVIPDVLKRPSIVLEKPRFSRGELSGMQQFLLPKTNVFQQTVAPTNATDAPDHYLQVVNPQYEELELILTVVLTPGTDENYAKLKINETLMNFIAPWRSGSTVSPTFGRSIARAKIIQLLEEMKEVDVIEKLEILHLVGDEFPSNPKLTLANKIAAAWKPFIVTGPNIHPGSARSVLTSAASHTVFISYRPTRTREEEPPEIPVVQPPAESKTVVPEETSRGLIPEGKKVAAAARTTKTKTAKRKK